MIGRACCRGLLGRCEGETVERGQGRQSRHIRLPDHGSDLLKPIRLPPGLLGTTEKEILISVVRAASTPIKQNFR